MPLNVIATPIGNINDASPRMRSALASAVLVLCEDTRRTRTLLTALEIPAPTLQSCHAHNEEHRVEAVMARLDAGDEVALVSDAGMPGISDPGWILVAAAHAAGHTVQVISGPSSITSAVAVSGFGGQPFHFLGFPPRKEGALKKWLAEKSVLDGALVILESGRRVGAVVAAAAALLPDREGAICRELTKKHEEVVRTVLSGLPTTEQRGEVVLVIGPGAPAADAPTVEVGPDLKTIAAALADRWGCTKREAYQALLKLESDRS